MDFHEFTLYVTFFKILNENSHYRYGLFRKIAKIIYRVNSLKSGNLYSVSFLRFLLENDSLGLTYENFEISRNSAYLEILTSTLIIPKDSPLISNLELELLNHYTSQFIFSESQSANPYSDDFGLSEVTQEK